MALQEKLDRFKKQQEKCQSTLTSIAASNKATSHKVTPVAAALSVARAPAPAVKFSNDTERLQHINSIQKSPTGLIHHLQHRIMLSTQLKCGKKIRMPLQKLTPSIKMCHAPSY